MGERGSLFSNKQLIGPLREGKSFTAICRSIGGQLLDDEDGDEDNDDDMKKQSMRTMYDKENDDNEVDNDF